MQRDPRLYQLLIRWVTGQVASTSLCFRFLMDKRGTLIGLSPGVDVKIKQFTSVLSTVLGAVMLHKWLYYCHYYSLGERSYLGVR